MVKEVGEENIQESLQTIVQKSINGYLNNERQATFDDKFTWQDFANTALLTTLITSIVSIRGAHQQANMDAWLDQDGRNRLISDIVSNQILYLQTMSSLNNIIDWGVKVNIVSIDTALSLKQELESAKKGHDLLQSHTKQVQQNIENEDVPDVVEGLKRAEENNNTSINYFDWKKSRFELTETQTRENSAMMDKVVAEITPENQSQKLQELRETIAAQYEQYTGKKLSFTDEQLLSLMDAHEQDGILWELTSWQLRVKVKILAETIADPEVRRFLLEAGFSGSIGTFLGKLFWQRWQPESAQTKTENGVEKKHNIDWLNTLIKEFDAIQDKSFNGLYKAFIEDIRSDTSYKDIFDSSVGVPDLWHETLRRHTSLVLNKFAEVESEYIIKDEYKDLIKKMILIHDIPKVFALKMGLEKSDQHTIAKAIIPSILDSLDITWAEKEIMNFMLCNDVIWETIQGTLTTEKYNNYKQKIYKLSRTANIGVQTLFEMQLLFYNSDAGSYAFLKHIFYDWSSTKSYEKFFMNLDPSLKRFWEIRNESIHIQESYKVGTPLEYYGKIKTFVDGLSIEEKKYLFREIINTTRTYGVTSMKKVSASMNSSEYWAWSLGLYAGELSGMYNSFNRWVIDENVCYSQLYILSYLWDLFLKKARLEDKVFDNYVQHKLLYRDITLKSDSKLFDEIVSLNPGDIYSDKWYFSTTEFAKISIWEYYNPYRGMPIDELEEKLRNIKNESHNQKYNDEINIGKAISADKDGTYAIKFIVTNSHSWVKIDQYVSTYHTDKETEVLFLPGTEWKVLRKKIDENKKTILITVEQI